MKSNKLRNFIFFLLILCGAVFFCFHLHSLDKKKQPEVDQIMALSDKIWVKTKEQRFLAEIFKTPKTRKKGLMFRKNLPENEGALFVFQKPLYYGFWMANVEFSLDIIWLNEKKIIIHKETVPPCRETKPQDCPIYKPKKRAQYVLEVGAGKFKSEVGDRVWFDLE